MNTIEAIKGRRSIRAFLDKPVEKEKLDTIFDAAQRSPSWANTQTWKVVIASGDTLNRIKAEYKKKHANKEDASFETPRPKEWSDAAKERMKQLRPSMARDCGDAAEEFVMLNQTLFNAPAVLFLCTDKAMGEWAMYDLGAYSQSLMLAAKELGLGTIPAIQLVYFPDVLRKEMNIPDNVKIAIGIAIGYEDTEHAINNFVSDRDSVDDCVTFFD